MKLYRFCCGCIGFEPSEFLPKTTIAGTVVARTVIVKSCDSDEPFGMRQRDVDYSRAYESGPKAGEVYHRTAPLNDNDRATVLASLAGLIADGYRMRAVKALLREQED